MKDSSSGFPIGFGDPAPIPPPSEEVLALRDTLSGGAIDTLVQLFKHGRREDGELPSKDGFAELVEKKLAVCFYDEGENTKPNRLTDAGVSLGSVIVQQISEKQQESLECLAMLFNPNSEDIDRQVAFNTLLQNMVPTLEQHLPLPEDDDVAHNYNTVLRTLEMTRVASCVSNESLSGAVGYQTDIVPLKEMAKRIMLGDEIERGTYLAGIIEERLNPLGLTLGQNTEGWSYRAIDQRLSSLESMIDPEVPHYLSAFNQNTMANIALFCNKRNTSVATMESYSGEQRMPDPEQMNAFLNDLDSATLDLENRAELIKKHISRVVPLISKEWESSGKVKMKLGEYSNDIPEASERPVLEIPTFPKAEPGGLSPVLGYRLADAYSGLCQMLARLNRVQVELNTLYMYNKPVLDLLLADAEMDDETRASVERLLDVLDGGAKCKEAVAQLAKDAEESFKGTFNNDVT